MTVKVWAIDSNKENPIVVKNVRLYDLREGFLILTMRDREQIAYNTKFVVGFNVEKDKKEPEATDIE